MPYQISDIRSLSISGIISIFTKPSGYSIYPITYKGTKYIVDFEVVNPEFVHSEGEEPTFVDYLDATSVYAHIHHYRERPSFFCGRKGKWIYTTDITILPLNDQKIDLRRTSSDDIQIHLPEIMQIIFTRWENHKQAAAQKQSAVQAAKSWDGVVRLPAELEDVEGSASKTTEEPTKSNSPNSQTKFFYELFNEVTCEEDVYHLVSTYTRTYETGRDQFWQKTEAALLNALCLQILLFEGRENCKQALEGYLKDLQRSDREKRTARADVIFANWSKHWPDTALKSYNLFLMIPPETQTEIIEGVQSLFIIESIEARERNAKNTTIST